MTRQSAVWFLVLSIVVVLLPLIVVVCLLLGKNPYRVLLVGFPRLIRLDGTSVNADTVVARVKRGEITAREAIWELGRAQ